MSKWKKCPICGGKIEKKLITVHQVIDNRLVIVENVPVEVCSQCGETLYTPSTMRKLERLVWAKPKPTREIKVPVLDMQTAKV